MGTREAAGWGLVGALSFLVLALGFQLISRTAIDASILLGVGLLVGMVAGVASLWLRPRIE